MSSISPRGMDADRPLFGHPAPHQAAAAIDRARQRALPTRPEQVDPEDFAGAAWISTKFRTPALSMGRSPIDPGRRPRAPELPGGHIRRSRRIVVAPARQRARQRAVAVFGHLFLHIGDQSFHNLGMQRYVPGFMPLYRAPRLANILTDKPGDARHRPQRGFRPPLSGETASHLCYETLGVQSFRYRLEGRGRPLIGP